jgi:hypothetical protein
MVSLGKDWIWPEAGTAGGMQEDVRNTVSEKADVLELDWHGRE